MKLFLTVALSLMMIALIAHAQPLPPPSYAPPPGYPPPPPPSYDVPPPPPPSEPPPGAVEVIPPPPQSPPTPQQVVTPAMPPMQGQTQTPPVPPALQAQQQGNITFVSGGAGDDDRAALKQVENQYNLRLLFAARSGEYLANVAVTLADARGNAMLDTIADGPIFYAHVPPGRYRLTVSNQGQAQSRDLTVSASGAVSQDFYWAAAS